LTISTVGRAAPPTLRVVNGTDSSVQKHPYVVSKINDGHVNLLEESFPILFYLFIYIFMYVCMYLCIYLYI